ncbi:centrosomal protein of 83 kDa-like [Rhopilema esculentum]|uniref:centrosomal protein of 83 kDa-like n=1 Tax=Rhopilema esculentum TaxID=499914 RepID=UPI0031E4466B
MMADAYTQAETLQKLERLTQLETMVAEQRIRIEKYRTMYETIKTEHVQLEEEKTKQDNAMKASKEELHLMQQRFQELINQARLESDQKIQECEELKIHVMTPQKMEVLRVKLQEEVEAAYKQKLETADLELDKYRSDFNKLRYEYSFLKSEYEHEQTRARTMLEELTTQHRIEVDILNKDKEDLTEQLRRHEEHSDAQRLRTLQKENAQLNMKVKSLLDELDDIREKREASGLQSDHVTRLQARQLTELSAHCKSLEAEKDALKMQLERVQAELDRAVKQQEISSHSAMKFERENLQIRSEMEELIHNHKVEINNVRLCLTKDKGDLERERDSFESQLQTSNNKISVLTQNIEALKEALSKKEEELVRRVQEVKETEWEKISKLESHKLQAESQLAEIERERNDLESMQRQQIEKLRERLGEVSDIKDQLEKELNSVKMKLSQQVQIADQLEEAKRQNQEHKAKHQKLQNDYESLVTIGEEVKAENEKLKDRFSLLKKELKLSNEDMEKQQENFERSIKDTKKKMETEKKGNEKELNELKKQLQDAKKKIEKIVSFAKKKNKKQKKVIEDLMSKIESQRVEKEKTDAEKKTLVRSLNLEHERTKRAFERLRKRQTQFTHLLHASSASIQEPTPGPFQQNQLLTMSFEPPRETTSSKMHRDIDNLSPIPNIDELINDTSP